MMRDYHTSHNPFTGVENTTWPVQTGIGTKLDDAWKMRLERGAVMWSYKEVIRNGLNLKYETNTTTKRR